MAIRQIEYTVSAEGISPNVRQLGGVQGEHNVTEVVFNISSSLWSKLEEIRAEKEGSGLYYRFDLYDSIGNKAQTAAMTFDTSGDKIACYSLERSLTAAGGVVSVVLVITLCDTEETHAELYSFPAVIQLKDRPYQNGDLETEEYDSVSRLSAKADIDAKRAEAAATDAEMSADAAADAKDKTLEAKGVLERGSIFIFNGGNAAGEVDTDGDGTPDRKMNDVLLVVDGEMSNVSDNPVKNKVTKAYIDNLITESINIAKEEILRQAKLDAHPVGSLYWSSDPTPPSEIFGGMWKRLYDVFVYAAGEDAAGMLDDTVDGEETHILEENELPKHSHTGIYYVSSGVEVGIGGGESTYRLSFTKGGGNESADLRTGYTGAGDAHNNMPPYIKRYMWERIE